MKSNKTGIRNILYDNIKDMKQLTLKIIDISKKLDNLECTVKYIYSKLEISENSNSDLSSGIKSFPVPHESLLHNYSSTQRSLDSSRDELKDIIYQHPGWLKSFSITAELQKKQGNEKQVRLIRSSSGYIKVIRLTDGSEWAYIEPMKIERFKRILLLNEAFEHLDLSTKENLTVFVTSPIKVQPLQKSMLWEITCLGKLELDHS
ncbi:MAG: hypothetical protein ACK587_07115 [Cyanobacteriota bacterium]